ncbi:hypothetical protein EHS25_002439 [Saitozyma podzolica]|uniref:Pre-rRNA-processing protein n=1 Tax=Saitozyma podzolica TaxID=1890683 RepID=A0A427YEE5_9TREE|nr:hypothetical protein EHS25_002439 [Saitozyma podzolica]
MPKATKKKKDKDADFTKAKLKLGKGKKAPSNATDTSFKARSIALPGQNPLVRALADRQADGSGEGITAQGLTLDEVLVRFRHPNAGVRRESLGGLKEILVRQPDREIGKVLRALGALIGDDDATVRKSLLGLFGWYIPANPYSLLQPHLPLLLLQTSSALSNIFPEIRLDAAKLVHLLLQHVPSQVTAGWPAESLDCASSSKAALDGASSGESTILEGLRLALGLGGEKATSAQNRMSAGGKLVILKALLAFVTAALRGASKGEDEATATLPRDTFGIWRPSGERESKNRGKERAVVAPDSFEQGWFAGVPDWGVDVKTNTSWEVGRLGGSGELGGTEGVVQALSQLYLQLHPLLLSTFLESAPTAFSVSQSSLAASSSSEETSLALCTVCASLAEVLASTILSSETSPASATAATAVLEDIPAVRSSISDFLRRMAAWFPFHLPRAGTATASSGLSPAFALSLSYAKLAVLLAPRPARLIFPRGRGRRRELGLRGRVRAVEEAWKTMRDQASRAKSKGKASGGVGADIWALEEVANWVEDVLSQPKDALAPPLTPSAYAALLPIIFPLLAQPPPPRGAGAGNEIPDIPLLVGTAFLQHLSRQSSTSAIRSLGDQFLVGLIEVHERRHPQYPFFLATTSPLRGLLRTWFESTPKTLWELGSRDPAATQRLLRFLLQTGLRGTAPLEPPFSLFEASTFQAISTKLAPYFYLIHPTRGAIPGPWTRLESPDVKKLGMEVAQVWTEWDESGALARAVEQAKTSSGGAVA